MQSLNGNNLLSNKQIDNYFQIAGFLSTEEMNLENKLKAIKVIIENGIEIYSNDKSQTNVKKEVRKQLLELNQIIESENDLLELKNGYSEVIRELLNT